MAEQGSKSGSRAESRLPTHSAEDDSGDVPEPTYSEARVRQPLGSPVADADTKVERRASVRPSAFGAPRKSVPPATPAREQNAELSKRLDPHERVLEAARLLDAVAPSLLPGDDSLYAPNVLLARSPAHFDNDMDAQRLPNQRARGVEHLVARGSAALGSHADPGASTSSSRVSTARSSAGSLNEAPPQRAEAQLGQTNVAQAARPPQAGSTSSAAPGHAGRFRRPWLSLVLFGATIALSVVPLLRYTQSSEDVEGPSALREPTRAHAASPSQPERIAAVVPLAPRADEPAANVGQVSPAHLDEPALKADLGSAGREQAVASALSQGMHALDAGDTREAERLFGHVLELSEDNPRAAYGLSRIRLIQNNLSGAEGWIQLALRKRPRRASYHVHYAEVLTRMGRIGEAREEQARASASAHRDNEEP